MSRRTVRVELGERSYDIVVGDRLLEDAGPMIAPIARAKRAFLAYDAGAEPHAMRLAASLDAARVGVELHSLPAGEGTKCTAQLAALWERMAASRLGRDALAIAVGGGVAGDLVGFAAATYLRGIDFVQVPTTLLAMVDSSVGGKTGINLPQGKNLAGAFHQPRLVLADLGTLATLPAAECSAALAEVIKYGVIRDADFFAWLEAHIDALRGRSAPELLHAVVRSCEIKAEVVGADERESGLREILNLGHTIGHAVENVAGYGALRHGEAIAIGMAAEGALAHFLGTGWSSGEQRRLVALCERAGLPTTLPEELRGRWAALLDAARGDKKSRAGTVRYVLPVRIGETVTRPVADADVLAALDRP